MGKKENPEEKQGTQLPAEFVAGGVHSQDAN